MNVDGAKAFLILLAPMFLLTIVTWAEPSTPSASAFPAVAPSIIDQLGGVSRTVAVSDDGIAYLGVGPRVVALDVTGDDVVELGRGPVLPGIVVGIAVDGGLAYVAAEAAGGLRILDISDPSEITEVGALDGIGNARGVDVEGEIVLVAAADDGLVIVDVSLPESPRRIGGLGPMSWVGRVQAHGDLAILVSGEVSLIWNGCEGLGGGLPGGEAIWVVNVSDPTAPSIRSSIPTPGWQAAAIADAERLYVATATMDPRIYGGSRALRTFDISNPDSPRELAVHATEWINCMALRIQGDRLYAACHGLSTFDIEDRDHPRWIGDGYAGTWYDIAIAPGQRLVVAADYRGAHLVDVSVASAPAVVDDYATLGFGCRMVAERERLAVFEPHGWIDMIGRGDDGLLVERARIDLAADAGLDFVGAGGLAFAGDHLVVATQSGDDAWLDRYDVSEPSRPRKEPAFETGLKEASVIIDGARALLLGLTASGGSDFSPIFQVEFADIDLSDPVRPRLRSFSPIDLCRDTVVSESDSRPVASASSGRLYAVVDKCGMAVLDFSEHFLPRALGGVTLRGRALKAAPMILGDIVYLPIGAEKIGSATTFHGGLAIVDVADPARPEIVGTVPWGADPLEGQIFARIGDRLFARSHAGVIVMDIADPRAPSIVGRLIMPGGPPAAIASDGESLFVLDNLAGLIELDTDSEVMPMPTFPPTAVMPPPRIPPLPLPTSPPIVLERVYLPFALRPG